MPVLAGITVAAVQGDEGVVTDVIGTRGVKVRIGNQVKDVYYIGLGGIEQSHPYYAKAVEAHRAMVVGQKVKIVYDAVRQDNDGHSVAYVYLGSGASTNALLNGKLLAAGLSRLGDFAGNDRMRHLPHEYRRTRQVAQGRNVGRGEITISDCGFRISD